MDLEKKIAELGSYITVKIADKNISLSEFKDYTNGSTIEFDKVVGAEVDLMLHSKSYGKAILKAKDNKIYLKIIEIY